MTKVWDLPAEVAANRRIVLLALADHANDAGQCWPGLETVGRKCAMSTRNVRRLVHDLIRDGFVSELERPGKNSVYTLHLAPTNPGQSVRGASDRPASDPGQSVRGTPDNAGRDPGQRGSGPRTTRARLKEEPSLNHHEPCVSAEDQGNGKSIAGLLAVCFAAGKTIDDVAWILATQYGQRGGQYGVAPKGATKALARWLWQMKDETALLRFAAREFLVRTRKLSDTDVVRPVWETVLAKRNGIGSVNVLRRLLADELTRQRDEAERQEREARDRQHQANRERTLEESRARAGEFAEGQAVEHPVFGPGVVRDGQVHFSGVLVGDVKKDPVPLGEIAADLVPAEQVLEGV